MKKHEVECHNVVVDETHPIPAEEQDDIFNYQCNLLNYGLLYANFSDAISEGEGVRFVRCWKFLLLHFHVDGSSSVKYALDALYLQFQQKVLLSPRQAYLQKWNRSVNHHGSPGKIVAFDLDLVTSGQCYKELCQEFVDH